MTFAELRRQKYKTKGTFAVALQAAGIYVSIAKVSHWEHAQDLPRKDQLSGVATALGVPVSVVIAACVQGIS